MKCQVVLSSRKWNLSVSLSTLSNNCLRSLFSPSAQTGHGLVYTHLMEKRKTQKILSAWGNRALQLRFTRQDYHLPQALVGHGSLSVLKRCGRTWQNTKIQNFISLQLLRTSFITSSQLHKYWIDCYSSSLQHVGHISCVKSCAETEAANGKKTP